VSLPLRNVAYHEAGHAAAQLIFDQAPDFVTIQPGSGKLGFASHMDGDDFTEEGMRQLVINCYAGREAEMRIGGDGYGSDSDDQQAEEYLKSVGTEEQMRRETAQFVTEHWQLIDRIACELLEHTTLELYELEILLAIYRGEETEEDLQNYRSSFAFQRALENFKASGLKRGSSA